MKEILDELFATTTPPVLLNSVIANEKKNVEAPVKSEPLLVEKIEEITVIEPLQDKPETDVPEITELLNDETVEPIEEATLDEDSFVEEEVVSLLDSEKETEDSTVEILSDESEDVKDNVLNHLPEGTTKDMVAGIIEESSLMKDKVDFVEYMTRAFDVPTSYDPDFGLFIKLVANRSATAVSLIDTDFDGSSEIEQFYANLEG